jgi:cyclohexyl-isocyanide hydratase
MSTPLQIGLLVFPNVTQLDLTGPVQVFSSVPGAKLHLIWKRIEPVASDSVLVLTPTTTFADCPQLDVICVPGGVGSDNLLNDADVLDFLRRQAEAARFITSVCTGSLVLGAAGLLKGYRAASTGPRWITLQPSAQRRPRRGSASTATASPAAA